MQFVFAPEGAEPKKWDFAPERMLNSEAEVIERKTGMRFAAWREAVLDGSMLAIHGLLYVLLKRENPTLLWDQVVFTSSDCAWELEDAELARRRAELEEASKTRELDEREYVMLAYLRAIGPDGEDEEPAEDEGEADPTPPTGDGESPSTPPAKPKKKAAKKKAAKKRPGGA